MRGFCQTGDVLLFPNLSNAESTGNDFATPTATGFTLQGGTGSWPTGATYAYLVIRRPNKPPTSGTEVFSPGFGSSSGTWTVNAGFPVDLAFYRATTGSDGYVSSRLQGAKNLHTTDTAAEVTSYDLWDSNTTWRQNQTGNFSTWISWLFRRAPGVFDQVCYTGTGSAHTEAHNLGVVPELMIVKQRGVSARHWVVGHSFGASNYNVVWLNETTASSTSVAYSGGNQGFGGQPSTTTFTVDTTSETNYNTYTYTAYLFATKAGISKVGSYTGNGGNQTIDCGFAAGARFFLVKATSTTGSWWLWDSTRGIVSGTDFGLQLNSTAAETTSADAVDPDASGIIVNEEATCSINANGVSYNFLALS